MPPSPPQLQPQSPLTRAERCCLWIWDYMTKEIDERMAERKANALLVAASVIAAMNYQGVISPPGGVYQDTKTVNGTIEYEAGQAIAAYGAPKQYRHFSNANCVSFNLSMTTMFLCLSGLSLNRRIFSLLLTASMFATMTVTTLSYMYAIKATTPAHDPLPESEWEVASRSSGSYALFLWFFNTPMLIGAAMALECICKVVRARLRSSL